MKRNKEKIILSDLEKKMVFVTGPRQVGKTWLAKKVAESFLHPVYLNYDRLADRKIIRNESWLSNTDLIIFDEIHKMKDWKNYLKGVFDTREEKLRILITGSARLETFHKAGDSLAGRYFLHHLLPFTPFEVAGRAEDLNPNILSEGGFPEPLLSYSERFVKRWRNFYINGLLREDVADLTKLAKNKELELLLELLRQRVCSPVSFSSLSTDLQISPNTVKRYIEILEALYIVFRVTPFSNNIARSILKEPKLYFYDTGMVIGDAGQKLENAVAVSLMDYTFRQYEEMGEISGLHYIRTKEKKEIDFCLTKSVNPILFLEVKNSDYNLSKTLCDFSIKYKVKAVQLVGNLKRERIENDIEIRDVTRFLTEELATEGVRV
ncbi:MAG: ATP-binding protein [Candidatus Cloacimonetes bacterium]|nr:ATP-binding protein [Candidatus Cloacimonadota bacterium]